MSVSVSSIITTVEVESSRAEVADDLKKVDPDKAKSEKVLRENKIENTKGSDRS